MCESVSIISPRIWREMYGSDPNVIGKPIRFAELSSTVVGVAPPHIAQSGGYGGALL